MRVLVTGSSGLIGESVAECIGREAEVIGLDIRPGRITTRIGDIRDPKSVCPLLDGVEAVVNLAALLTPHVGSYMPNSMPNAELVPVGYWDRDAGRRMRLSAHRTGNRLRTWVARSGLRPRPAADAAPLDG